MCPPQLGLCNIAVGANCVRLFVFEGTVFFTRANGVRPYEKRRYATARSSICFPLSLGERGPGGEGFI